MYGLRTRNLLFSTKIAKKFKNLDEVDPELLQTFEKLAISLTEQKRLSKVALDIVFDSVSSGTTFQEELKQCDFLVSTWMDQFCE